MLARLLQEDWRIEISHVARISMNKLEQHQNNTMNKRMKLGASLAAILTVTSLSAVEIGPTGSGIELSGFADLRFQSAENGNARDNSFDTSQVEIDLDFETGPVYFNVDVDFTAGGDGAYLEEAVVGYDFGNGFGLSAGRSLSYLGWEAYDPINMLQYSYAFDLGEDTDANGKSQFGGPQDIYDAFRDGGMASYSNDLFAASVWLGFDPDDGDDSARWEYMVAFTGIENFVAKAIFADDPDDHEIYTIWASYTFGNLMLAGEVAEKDSETLGKIEGWLVLADYSVTDKLGLVVRYSDLERAGGDATLLLTDVDSDKITVSPHYAITNELTGRIEYSSEDLSGGNDSDLFAAELIYTF